MSFLILTALITITLSATNRLLIMKEAQANNGQ